MAIRKEKILERSNRLLDAAYDLFVEKTIESVSIQSIADAAQIGVASVYRYYANKPALVIAVAARKWKQYLDSKLESRTYDIIKDIPAIDRLAFTLDIYIELYENRKDLLIFNANLNHYLSHEECQDANLEEYYNAISPVDQRFRMMYERAKEDHTLRTDIPEDLFFRLTVHSMMSSCQYYASGFAWGAKSDKDYKEELLLQKEMILEYARGSK